jgi:hypothetical protein
VIDRKDGADLDMDLVNTIVMAIKPGFYHLDGAEGNYIGPFPTETV